MKKFKIFQQTNIIDDIMQHLKNGCMGMAIARDWDYERTGNTITFTLKEGHEINLDAIFWFGYFSKE